MAGGRRSRRTDEPIDLRAPPPLLDAIGRAYWYALAAELRSESGVDWALLGVLCHQLQVYRHAADELAQVGFSSETDRGNVVMTPAASVMRTAAGLILRISQRLRVQPPIELPTLEA